MTQINNESTNASIIDLTRATDREIDSLISQYGLHATASFLRDVGACLNAEKITPDEEILRFFDAIFVESTSDVKNVNVSELFSDDEEIIKTFADLFSKHNHLCSTQDRSISLSDMSQVASKYLHTLNVSAPSSVEATRLNKDIVFSNGNGVELLSLSLDDSPALPYGYVSASSKTVKEDLPVKNEDLFFMVDSFDVCKNEALNNICKKIITIEAGGIISAICNSCYGALIYCDATGVAKNLSELVTLHKDKPILVISPENEAAAIALFEANKITAKKIAKASRHPAFTVVTATRVVNMKADFLRHILGTKVFFAPRITSDIFEPASYDGIYVSKDGTKEKLNTLCNYRSHQISALQTSKCSFTSGINIVIDSLFSLLSTGVDRKKVGMTVKIFYTEKSLSQAVATLLGVYRAAIELSLPELDSSFVLSDSDHIFCCAFAKDAHSIPDKFADIDGSYAHLFSFGRFDNTSPRFMPDFSSIRKICDLVTDLISKNVVVAAKAIDGPVYSSAKEMCRAGQMLMSASESTNEINAQGFILQLSKNIMTNSPIVGVVKKDNL